MFSSSHEPVPLGARIYAAKVDTDCDLSGEWIMVASPIAQCATFYAVRTDPLFSAKDHAFGNPARYTTPRFVVHFADLEISLMEDDPGTCIIFPQFREDLEGRRHIIGEVMIERDRLISLIRTVGLLAFKNDEEWIERVVLISPEMEEQDISYTEAGKQIQSCHTEAENNTPMADALMSPLASMQIAAF